MLSSFIFCSKDIAGSHFITFLRLSIIILFLVFGVVLPLKRNAIDRRRRLKGFITVLFVVDLTVLLLGGLLVYFAERLAAVWVWFLSPIVCLGLYLILAKSIEREDARNETAEGEPKPEIKKSSKPIKVFARLIGSMMGLAAVVLIALLMREIRRGFIDGIWSFTAEESQASFNGFEKNIETVAEAYGLELEKEYHGLKIDGETYGESARISYEYRLKVNEHSYITLNLRNRMWDIFDTGSGDESFGIAYYLLDPSVEYDYGLFASLVNCVSGHRIMPEYCKEFMIESENRPPDSYQDTLKYHSVDLDRFHSDYWTIRSCLPIHGKQRTAIREYGFVSNLAFSGRTSSKWSFLFGLSRSGIDSPLVRLITKRAN